MTRRSFPMLCALVLSAKLAVAANLEIPITPFSNMASGFQATNPGFRAVLRSPDGSFIAGGPLTMDAVIQGYVDDASEGTSYGRLVLSVDLSMIEAVGGSGEREGILSICMAENQNSAISRTKCKDLGGANIEAGRPFQWLNKPVTYEMNSSGDIRITRFSGSTGEGGTSRQIALAVYHPAYGFAAPGKAFKDYQSPLVLDLNRNGKLELLSAWSKERAVYFDMNGSGRKTRTGWVGPSDGFLFIDDGTGCVHNGSQLLGEYTGSPHGKKMFSNGFEALKASVRVERDGRILPKKNPQLKVWRNLGADGICRPSEVFPLSKFARELWLDYKASAKTKADNEIRLVGRYVGLGGKSWPMGDVWFKQLREGNTPPVTSNPENVLRSVQVTKRTPINVSDIPGLRTYAQGNDFLLSVNPRAGMRVMYSASYGMGNEAGQSSGVLVQDGEHLWFKQENNPTQQLMLPPGLPFGSSNKTSLWDIREYLMLVNRVAFSAPNEVSFTSNDVYGRPDAALVDFKGGTAGQSISYKDALEVVFQKSVGDRSESNLAIYYAKGIGPVALEFSENKTPSGTFKLYMGY